MQKSKEILRCGTCQHLKCENKHKHGLCDVVNNVRNRSEFACKQHLAVEKKKVIQFDFIDEELKQRYLMTTESIKNITKDNTNNYLYLGLLLRDMQIHKWYEQGGYENISQYALNEFGFMKSYVYDLIAVNKRFSMQSNRQLLDKRFEGFSFKQLSKMLPLSDDVIKDLHRNISLVQITELLNAQNPHKQCSGAPEKSKNSKPLYEKSYNNFDDFNQPSIMEYIQSRFKKGLIMKIYFEEVSNEGVDSE